jgi:hypothetical protein
MRGNTRHHIQLNLPEIYLPGIDPSSLLVEVDIKHNTSKSRFPFPQPLSLEIRNLSEDDILYVNFF